MVERIEKVQQSPLVEDLVLELGVPVAKVRPYTEALYAAFGREDQPTERIIDYLVFQVARRRKNSL